MANSPSSKPPPQSQYPCTSSPSDPQRDVKETSKPPRRNSNTSRAKFLGVRQRPSGKWVAEIKDTSQKLRLWLGTFDGPEEAAMAYDNAARLLRGRNAKTNFPYSENKSGPFARNGRFYQLLHHAIMKSHAKSSSLEAQSVKDYRNNDFSCHVEETIVCDSSYGKAGADCGFERNKGSSGFSKVHSSVHVAPSFSASFLDGDEENIRKQIRISQMNVPSLHVNDTSGDGFI